MQLKEKIEWADENISKIFWTTNLVTHSMWELLDDISTVSFSDTNEHFVVIVQNFNI